MSTWPPAGGCGCSPEEGVTVTAIKRHSSILVTVATAMLALAACGDGSSGSTEMTTPPPAPEAAPPSSSPSSSGIDPDTAFIGMFEPTVGSAETWNLVALGDSTTSGWYVRRDGTFYPEEAYPGIYAGLLAEEQGVNVTLHSYFPSQSGNEVRSVADWNAVLAEDESMRADLVDAEVVMVWIGFHNIVPAVFFGRCNGNWREYGRCVRSATRTMPSDYDELFATLERLVPEGATVLVGNMGVAPFIIERWADDPHWREVKRAVFDEWIEAMEEAALAHGARVVDTYRALGGPSGDEPLHSGFSAADGLHFSAKAQRFLAEVHLEQDGIEPPK
jgi:lysophospholipase L1-like esterase